MRGSGTTAALPESAMNALQSIRDRVRSLAGEQSPGRLPRRTAKPPIGARIVQVESGVRLTVQAGRAARGDLGLRIPADGQVPVEATSPIAWEAAGRTPS
jgi:hypothetical protein